MQSRGFRIGLLVVLAAAAVALFLVLSGDDDSGDDNGTSTTAGETSSTATTPPAPGFDVIEIADGAPVGGVQELSYDQSERIRIKVIPEPGVEEIHFHGYEVEKSSDGETPVIFDLPADLAGGFELEAHTHDGEFALASIKVQP